jgi:hypothetical protein
MPTLDLKKQVFKTFGPVDERLSVALVQKARATVEPGWLLECFTTDTGTVSLIFRALLATKYQQNNELSAALDKLLGNGIIIIDEEFLRKAFQGMNKGKVNTEQTITDFAISNLVNAFTSPAQVLLELETKRSEGRKAGWIKEDWFSGSTNKKRMTNMESFTCQLQTLLIMGEIVETKECERVIAALVYAWGVDHPRTIKRQIQAIRKQIQQPLIEYPNRSKAEQEADLSY